MRQYYFVVDVHEIQLWISEQGRNAVNDSAGQSMISGTDVVVIVGMIIFYVMDK